MPNAIETSQRDTIAAQAELQRDWLRHVMELTGLRATPLAKQAGLAPSTLLRALETDNLSLMDSRTIAKICQRFSIDPPAGAAPAERPTPQPFAMKEEGARYDGPEILPRESDTIERWELKGRFLELAGYLPGDILFVDRRAIPRPLDVVCAQHYDLTKDTADTIFRVYDPPFLLTRAKDDIWQRKPLIVDNDRVVIMGVVVKLLRPYRGSAA